MSAGVPDNRFSRYTQNLQLLLDHFPPIHRLLDPSHPLESLDGWNATVGRYAAVRQQGGRPALVATLYGPSGAGKSTLFRMLTGIEVPVGEVRPTTRACVASVPPELNRPDALKAIFPQFAVEPLTDLQRLGEIESATNRLFVATGTPQTGQVLPFVLGDVPDFNSIETANWERAEQMLRRAEVVLFVVYSEGYADERTVQELARCCKLSARMAYVLTKVRSPEAAKKIWESLPRQLATGRHAPTFAEKRADGRTLLEFLQQAPAYFSPHAPNGPKLDDIQPMNSSRPLLDILGGYEGEAIVLAGLMEPVSQFVTGCRRTLGRVDGEIQRVEKDLATAREPLSESARRIAGEEFPIGRFFELVMQEVMAQQPSWFERAMRYITGAVNSIYSLGKKLVKSLSGDTGELKPRGEQEKQLLALQSEALFDIWRVKFPAETQSPGFLASEGVAKLRHEFQGIDVPPPAIAWEERVRAEARKWADEHPWVRRALPVLVPVLGASLAIWAAPATTVAVIVGGGVGIGAGGILAEMIAKLHLQESLQRASDEWRDARHTQMIEHLEKNLFAKVFQPWIARETDLRNVPIAECQKACEQLEQLQRELATKGERAHDHA